MSYVCVCVCVCVCFLALVVQHAMRMRLIILSSGACLALPYFYTLCHKLHKSNTSVRRVGLVFLCFSRLPEDGTWVPKHVGIVAYHELYFMIYIYCFYRVHFLVNLLEEYNCI